MQSEKGILDDEKYGNRGYSTDETLRGEMTRRNGDGCVTLSMKSEKVKNVKK